MYKYLPFVGLWYFLGSTYLAMEGLWRGWTHGSMLIVGGLCGLAIGAINQSPRFYDLPIVWQSLMGTVLVLAVEFVSGCVLNLWLGLGVWDYTGQFGNVLGQICLPYALLWFAICPFAIWLEDTLRWMLYLYAQFWSERVPAPAFAPYSLRSIYKDLISGR